MTAHEFTVDIDLRFIIDRTEIEYDPLPCPRFRNIDIPVVPDTGHEIIVGQAYS